MFFVFDLQGARGFPGTPGLPGMKGHRVSADFFSLCFNFTRSFMDTWELKQSAKKKKVEVETHLCSLEIAL